jgi:hypothetical protein
MRVQTRPEQSAPFERQFLFCSTVRSCREGHSEQYRPEIQETVTSRASWSILLGGRRAPTFGSGRDYPRSDEMRSRTDSADLTAAATRPPAAAPPHAGTFCRRRVIPVLLLALAGIGVAPPAQAAVPSHHVVSIAQARTLPLGTAVTVEGTATTPAGAFESSFFDKGFAIQDRGAGIYVSIAAGPGVAPRDRVRVTGTLRDSFGLRVLVPDNPAAVLVRGRGPRITPEPVATGSVGEATEGLLVRVTATITQAPAPDLPYGDKFFVDDGSGELTIFVNTQTGIDLAGLTAGRTVRVIGFSSQFDTHYEIDPRFAGDITVRKP